MNKFRTYEFRYNVPAENNITGKPNLFIEASAEWQKDNYHQNGRPVLINAGPIMNKLTRQQLFLVKDWHLVFHGIEQVAGDYFLDQYTVQSTVKPEAKTVVQIAEEVLS